MLTAAISRVPFHHLHLMFFEKVRKPHSSSDTDWLICWSNADRDFRESNVFQEYVQVD